MKGRIVDTNARVYYGITDDELPAHVARRASKATAVGGQGSRAR